MEHRELGDVGGLPEVTPAEDTQQERKRPGVERIYRSWRLVWKGSPSTPIQGNISEHVELVAVARNPRRSVDWFTCEPVVTFSFECP